MGSLPPPLQPLNWTQGEIYRLTKINIPVIFGQSLESSIVSFAFFCALVLQQGTLGDFLSSLCPHQALPTIGTNHTWGLSISCFIFFWFAPFSGYFFGFAFLFTSFAVFLTSLEFCSCFVDTFNRPALNFLYYLTHIVYISQDYKSKHMLIPISYLPRDLLPQNWSNLEQYLSTDAQRLTSLCYRWKLCLECSLLITSKIG